MFSISLKIIKRVNELKIHFKYHEVAILFAIVTLTCVKINHFLGFVMSFSLHFTSVLGAQRFCVNYLAFYECLNELLTR